MFQPWRVFFSNVENSYKPGVYERQMGTSWWKLQLAWQISGPVICRPGLDFSETGPKLFNSLGYNYDSYAIQYSFNCQYLRPNSYITHKIMCPHYRKICQANSLQYSIKSQITKLFMENIHCYLYKIICHVLNSGQYSIYM